MLDLVTAKQWDANSGGLEYVSRKTGLLSIEEVLETVDAIADTPSLDSLGDEYGGSRGWIIVQEVDTIFHAYIDESVKVEYFGEENSTRLETDGVAGLYAFIEIDVLRRVLKMLDDGEPIAEYIRANAIAGEGRKSE